MFSVGLGSLIKKKALRKWGSQVCSDIFLKFLNFAQCHLGLYSAAPSGGFRLPIPCVLPFVGEDVDTCNRHNLHRIGYTENDKQNTVDSQGVTCLPSL